MAKRRTIPEPGRFFLSVQLPVKLGELEFEEDAGEEEYEAVTAFTTLLRAREELEYARADAVRAAVP